MAGIIITLRPLQYILLFRCLFILAYNHVHGKVCNQTIIIPMNLIICSLMQGGVSLSLHGAGA